MYMYSCGSSDTLQEPTYCFLNSHLCTCPLNGGQFSKVSHPLNTLQDVLSMHLSISGGGSCEGGIVL